MNSSPIIRFKSWLNASIKEKGGGWKLPTQAMLAERFGISKSSVKSIVTELVKIGVLCSLTRRGTFVEPYKDDGEPVSFDEHSTSLERLYKNLLEKINEGSIQRGQALPQVKQIALQYSVSKDTVIKAYQRLKQNGYSVKLGKRYWVGGFNFFVNSMSSRKIFLFYNSTNFMLGSNHWQHSIFNEMERELQHCGNRLIFKRLEELDNQIKIWKHSDELPQGILITDCDQSVYDSLLPKLQRFQNVKTERKPSILFNTKRLIKTMQGMHYFTHGSIHTQTGRKIAEYCQSQKISELKIFYDESLEKLSDFRDCIRFIAEAKILNPGINATVHYKSKADSGFEQRMSSIIPVEKDWKSFVNRTLSKYDDSYKANSEEIIFQEEELHNAYFKPRKSESSLWVFLQDAVAAQALEWADKKNLSIGKDTFIIGLENDPQFLALGISTLVPNWPVLAYLFAHTLLKDLSVKKSGQGYIRPPINLFHRQTT